MNLYDNQKFWVGRVEQAKRSSPHTAVFKVTNEEWRRIVKGRVDIIKKLTSPKDKIIDFGCAYGWLSQEIPNPYVGIDQTEALVHYGRELYPGIEIVQKEMQNKLPFEDNSFDFVVSSCVKYGIVECEDLGEMPKGRWQKIEEEMMRLAPVAIIWPSYGPEYEVIKR
jgi:SAM-dependent methyltransferase